MFTGSCLPPIVRPASLARRRQCPARLLLPTFIHAYLHRRTGLPQVSTQPAPDSSNDSSKTFRLDLSLGNDPDGMIPDATRIQEHKWTGAVEMKDGTLRIGRENPVDFDLAALASDEPGEEEAYDPFPALTTLRTWLSRIVRAIAIALPVALIALGIATDQTTDTVVFMAVFGLILSTMLMSIFSPPKSVVGSVIERYLRDAVRNHYEQAAQPSLGPQTQPTAPVSPTPRFSIECVSCGATFEPSPPRAICPHCAAPNLFA
jgi:hypothetical protein